MKKLVKLNSLIEVKEILAFICNDTLRGIFSKGIFKNKFNRILLIFLFIIGYLLYFYKIFKEVGNISSGLTDVEISILIENTKYSICNLFFSLLLISMLIVSLIKSTIKIPEKTMFTISLLPYEHKNLVIAKKIFEFFICLIFFELLIILLISQFSLLYTSFTQSLIILFICHLFFILGFLFVDLSFKLVSLINNNKIRNILNIFLNVIYFVLPIIFIFNLSFKISKKMANLDLSINQLIFTFFIISTLLIIILSLLLKFIPLKNTETNFKSRYIKIVDFKIGNMYILPIIRSKFTIYLTTLSLMTIIFFILSDKISNAKHVFFYVSCYSGICATFYGDSVIKFRKIVKLYKIGFIKEFLHLLVLALIWSIPSYFASNILGYDNSIETYFVSMFVFISCLLFGILFPKSRSSINELIGLMLSITFIVIFINILEKTNYSILAIIFIFICLLIVVYKENEVKK